MDFIIADSHYLSIRGLSVIIDDIFPDARIYEIPAKNELVRLLSVSPEAIVIINLASFDFPDLDAFLRIVARFENTRWILTYPDLSREALVRTTAEDISIIDLDGNRNDFMEAITAVAQKKRYICQNAKNELEISQRISELPVPLTNSEKEILRLMASGLSVKEMADIRCNSIHTIITHKKNIFRKLDVNTVHEAVKYALRSGLVELLDYYI